MPAFQYEAANAQGQISQGVLEADSDRHVRQLLKTQGLIALSSQAVSAPASSAQPNPQRFQMKANLSATERTLLVRQLASLLQARLPLEQALNALLAQAEKPSMAAMLGKVRSAVLGGASLSQALAQDAQAFPSEMVAMVAAGEQSGSLPVVLENWADYLEQRAALKQQVVSSLAYPAIVAVVALLMVLGLMTYVVPQIVGVFQNSKTHLPLLTQVMMFASKLLRDYGLWVLGFLMLLGFGLRTWLKNPAPLAAWHALQLRTPLVGSLVQAAQTERFASTLAILIRGGVPMLNALDAAKRTLSNTVFSKHVAAAIVRVQEGATLSRALETAQKSSPPRQRMAPLLTHLIASGEATGRLPDMLKRAAELQGGDLRRKLQILTTVLEPAIILVMGGVVLVIVLAVLLPIIEINQLVR